MSSTSRAKPLLLAAAVAAGLAIFLEVGVRLTGQTAFPLYRADNQVGYIPAPSQSSSFLGGTNWRFNSLGMNAGEFAPTQAALDVLLLGDTTALGDITARDEERLAAQLAKASGAQVWPVSAEGWALRNQLAYLRQHREVVKGADVVMLVLNSGDLGQAASWSCDLTHPTERPWLASVYVIRKAIGGNCDAQRADLKVPDGNWRTELRAFLRSSEVAGKPVHLFIYPMASEMANPTALQQIESDLRSEGAVRIVNIGRYPRWGQNLYRDGIHPSLQGMKVLAATLADQVDVNAGKP